MKIIQILADWKWTGPSGPVLILSKALSKRGHDVTLVAKAPPSGVEETESIVSYAEGLGVEIDTSLDLNTRTKPDNLFGVPGVLRDTRGLVAIIDDMGADVINVHSSHDHFIGGRAKVLSKRGPVLIRTDHRRDSIPDGLGNRFLMKRYTDGLITFSKKTKARLSENFGFGPDRVFFTDPALDIEEWDPVLPTEETRLRFGLPEDALVIGMVARFQRYRKTDIVISAFKNVVREFPTARLLLLGRSSQMEESVHRPAREMGVADKVITPGYIIEGYREALGTMDIFVFMVPGSDGTARALREAMAMGRPVVAANVGMVPEFIKDGVSGLIVKPDEGAIEAALMRLLKDSQLRERLGREGRRRAIERFDIDRQAKRTEEFYHYIKKNPRYRGAMHSRGRSERQV